MERVGSSSAEHAIEAAGDSKCQVLMLKGHFKKFLEETCPNHACVIKHKLRDCSLMKSFKTMGSLSQGMEINEAPIEGDTMPFLGEDAIMMLFGRHPSTEKRHGLDPSTRTPSRSS
jgi:hypothetical protein